MLSHNASPDPQDAGFAPLPSLPTHTQWLDTPPNTSDSSKTYHATAEWGKRGMTLQELTRAFDAFNEAEERVALGFAGSEDCNRTLAEPLSEVKTIFLDLDGLKPSSGDASLTPVSSVPTSFQRHNVWHMPQANADTDAGEMIELGYTTRNGSSACPTQEHHPAIAPRHRLDDDTIKPSHKRRQSSSTTTPIRTPSQYTLQFEDELDISIPTRPYSRLGYIDYGGINERGREGGEDTF